LKNQKCSIYWWISSTSFLRKWKCHTTRGRRGSRIGQKVLRIIWMAQTYLNDLILLFQLIHGRVSNLSATSEENRFVDSFVLAKNQFFLYLKLFLLMGISWSQFHLSNHNLQSRKLECTSQLLHFRNTFTKFW